VDRECSERIHLVDEYCRLITAFNNLLESLNNPSHERKERVWSAAAAARADSQIAWEALEKHIAEHKCIDTGQPDPDAYSADDSGGVLEKAARAAIDIILVADDDRRFVEVNEAAADAFGLSRTEVIGRRIDEFLATTDGKGIPAWWNDFIAAGAQSGICRMNAPGRGQVRVPSASEFRARTASLCLAKGKGSSVSFELGGRFDRGIGA
jgi:PAS domain-containing protein